MNRRLLINMRFTEIIFPKITLGLSIALVLLVGGMAIAETADDLFIQGIKAYENGEYQISIDKLGQALPLLKGERERLEALKTMAFAYMAFPKRESARQQFCNILQIDPTFTLDPIMTPPKILAVFQEAKEECILHGGIKVRANTKSQKAIHGAKTYLNGRLIGETPLQKEGILPGEYEIEVRKDGFQPFRSKVTIEAMVVLEMTVALVRMEVPTITSVSHDATGPLLLRDRIEVTLIGDSGKTATFDIGKVKADLPMEEISPGRYVGLYRIDKNDRFQELSVVGHLQGQDGGRASLKAERPITTSRLSRPQILFERGKVSLEQEEYELAIDSLTKALYEDPKFIEAHILLAKAYGKKKGAYLESVKYLKKAIEIDSGHLEAHSLLAKIYIENRRYESAKPVVERVLEIAPTNALAHGYMGEIFYHQGKYKEAVETLRKSLLLGQEEPSIYFLLGKTFERLGRGTDAVLEFETAVELSPTTYQYRDALATCYKTLGQEMAAIRHLEKCLEMIDLTEFERKQVKRKLAELRR